MMLSKLTLVITALGLCGLAGCGPAVTADGANDVAPDARPAIHVEHNLPVATSMTVTVIAPSAASRRLGTVGPGQREVFRLLQPAAAGDYRLVAEAVDGRRLVSPPFLLTGRDAVRWDMNVNQVVATGVEAPDGADET